MIRIPLALESIDVGSEHSCTPWLSPLTFCILISSPIKWVLYSIPCGIFVKSSNGTQCLAHPSSHYYLFSKYLLNTYCVTLSSDHDRHSPTCLASEEKVIK